eukprot:630865-Amorphochlora_amoeboformis.AAC.1
MSCVVYPPTIPNQCCDSAFSQSRRNRRGSAVQTSICAPTAWANDVNVDTRVHSATRENRAYEARIAVKKVSCFSPESSLASRASR